MKKTNIYFVLSYKKNIAYYYTYFSPTEESFKKSKARKEKIRW